MGGGYYEVIISVVGGQTIPVVYPYCYYKFSLGVFIKTSTTASQSEQIINFMKLKFPEADVSEIEVSSYDFKEIRSEIESRLKGFKEKKVLCNITGGTKPMAMELKGWGERHGKDLFYVSTEEDAVYIIQEGEIKKERVRIKLNVEEYLKLHGYEIEKRRKKEGESEGKKIGDIFLEGVSNGKFLGKKTYSFSFLLPEMKEIKKLLRGISGIKGSYDDSTSGIEISIPINERGILTLGRICEAFGYNRGEWLEEYVANVARKMEGEGLLDDVQWKVRVSKTGDTDRREIDLLFIKDHKLGVLSCKTFSGTQEYLHKTKEPRHYKLKTAIDEINSLGQFLGRYTLKFLVCITESEFSEFVLNKAREYDVTLIGKNEIGDLRNIILREMERTPIAT